MSEDSTNNQRKIPPKPLDPIGSIFNHLTFVVIITFGCLVIGIIGVTIKVKPSYQSGAIIKIEPVIPKILYGKEEASIMPYYDDYVNTQINIVKSFPVLSKAIEKYHAQGFAWRLPDESMNEAIKRLSVRLSIVQLRGTQLFTISMYSRRRHGLAELINTVVDAYLEINRETQLNKDSSRLDFLNKRKEETERTLVENYDILERISAKYAVGITDEKNIYVYLQAIVDLTQQLVKATSRKIEIESKLKELQNQMERLKVIDISADIDDWIEKDSAIRDNRIQVSRKLQDMHLVIAGLKDDHPEKAEHEENLENLYSVQEDLLKRARQVAENVIRGKLLSDQHRKILDLETEYAAAVSTEHKLRSELKKAERSATDVNTQMMKASTLRKEIQRLQDALLRIVERVDQIEVESRSAERIELTEKARKPEAPSGGKKPKMMIVVVVFSFVTGVGYAVIRDKLDDRIHTPSDIERVLGFPATSHIMEASQELEHIHNNYRVVLDNPFSHLSEQYKEISFALSKEHEKHQSKIYTCLSLAEGQGTSSFLTNTLCSLKGLKEKKIMVDLNVWSPMSESFVPDAGRGLWDVIEGECELKDAIVKDSAYPFHILPFGSWAKGQKSVFQEVGVDTVIEVLRLDYEYIMVDSPPLLLTTDAKFLAKLADVVVLIVQAEEVREKELFRAVHMLNKVEVQVISVILNRVKFMRGKYYPKTMMSYYRLINSDREMAT